MVAVAKKPSEFLIFLFETEATSVMRWQGQTLLSGGSGTSELQLLVSSGSFFFQLAAPLRFTPYSCGDWSGYIYIYIYI